MTTVILVIGASVFIYTRKEHISLRPSSILATMEGTNLYNPSEALFKNGNPNKNEVALTLDDGPHPKYLPEILSILKQNNLHATFFEVGEMMAKSPLLVRQVLADGNEIGNHTMTHPRLVNLTPTEIKNQILQCQETFASITGKKMFLFRPPGFREDPAILKQIKELGYITVGYSTAAHDFIVKGDFSAPDPNKVIASVMERLKPGGIILLHDAPGTAEALPGLIKQIQDRGYRIVMASELLAGLSHPVEAGTNAGPCSAPMGAIPTFAVKDGDKIHH